MLSSALYKIFKPNWNLCLYAVWLWKVVPTLWLLGSCIVQLKQRYPSCRCPPCCLTAYKRMSPFCCCCCNYLNIVCISRNFFFFCTRLTEYSIYCDYTWSHHYYLFCRGRFLHILFLIQVRTVYHRDKGLLTEVYIFTFYVFMLEEKPLCACVCQGSWSNGLSVTRVRRWTFLNFVLLVPLEN